MFYMKTVILRLTVIMKLTWNSPKYLTLQSEIIEITDSFATFRREATNPEVLRTFDSGRSPSLIVGCLEPATRLDKQGKRCTDGISDGVGCCIIQVCLQCGHITPQRLLHM